MSYLDIDYESQEIFNELSEGVLIIDDNARVVFANNAYLKFIGVKREIILGKHLRDFRKNARLPDVVKTGKKILHAQRLEDLEEAYFVNMYPIKRKGKVIGGISIITFMEAAERAREELERYKAKVNARAVRQMTKSSARFTFDDITVHSELSIQLNEFAKKIAMDDMNILITGESGTGKEMYAQAIHNYSKRKNNVFLAVNCANFNGNMLDSELFGYVEGSFTGAKKGGKMGLFEAARGGTLFLDEISEMDIGLQAKLLRAIQEQRIRPVGGINEIETDVRIICACNVDLPVYVEEGKFRKDLYYRLNTFQLRTLPLRERPNDIPYIAMDILEQINAKTKKNSRISDEVMSCFVKYDWPGNVRELKNVIEFSVFMSENDLVILDSLPRNLAKLYTNEPPITYDAKSEKICNAGDGTLANRVKNFEKQEIIRVLEVTGDTLAGKTEAAKILGISLASLYNKIK